MQTYAIIFVFFCAIASVRMDTPFKDCGSEAGTIVSFNVSGCTAAPCKFSKGTTYSMELVFNTKAPSKTSSINIHGVIAGVPVPFPLNQTDVCQMGAKCPISAGDKETINFSLPVLSVYPSISLYAKIEIVADDLKQDYACLLFPAVIVG